MVNPGVISLGSLNDTERVSFPYRFEIEDNIGEAIHIHYKDIRIDLTTKEFLSLAEALAAIIDEIVGVEGFSCHDFDPVNLVGISGMLANLKEIQYFNLHLEDIQIDTFDGEGNPIYAGLAQSRVVKALNGITEENDNHTTQMNYRKPLSAERISNQDRLLYNLKQIREHGYPMDKELIIVDENNRIWDGQHRAACLYYLYGNIEVPVRRLVYGQAPEEDRNRMSEESKTEYELYLREKEIHVGQKQSLKEKILGFWGKFLWATWAKTEYDKKEYFEKIESLERKLEEIGSGRKSP